MTDAKTPAKGRCSRSVTWLLADCMDLDSVLAPSAAQSRHVLERRGYRRALSFALSFWPGKVSVILIARGSCAALVLAENGSCSIVSQKEKTRETDVCLLHWRDEKAYLVVDSCGCFVCPTENDHFAGRLCYYDDAQETWMLSDQWRWSIPSLMSARMLIFSA